MAREDKTARPGGRVIRSVRDVPDWVLAIPKNWPRPDYVVVPDGHALLDDQHPERPGSFTQTILRDSARSENYFATRDAFLAQHLPDCTRRDLAGEYRRRFGGWKSREFELPDGAGR